MTDYAKEADYLTHVTEVIIHLKNYLDEHPVSYPPAMKVYLTIMYGLIPVINVNCHHDPDCQINMGQPVGGLNDVFEVMDTALECL